MTAASQDVLLFKRILGIANEAQRRWLVGREALRLGRGGIQRMVEASGLSKPTILKGIKELNSKRVLTAEEGRVRRIERSVPTCSREGGRAEENPWVHCPILPIAWAHHRSTILVTNRQAIS
jgi:hypothetical protein